MITLIGVILLRSVLILAWFACLGNAAYAKRDREATDLIYYLLLGLQITLLLIAACWWRP